MGFQGLAKVPPKITSLGTVIQTQDFDSRHLFLLSPFFIFIFPNLSPKASNILLFFPLNTKNPSGNILCVLGSHYENWSSKKNDSDLLFMAISIVTKGDRPNNSPLLQMLL